MSATALRNDFSEYEPDVVEDPSCFIGAHADYSRDDFIFPRMQSRAMREDQWENRLKPMKSWSEIIGIGVLMGGVSLAVIASASFM